MSKVLAIVVTHNGLRWIDQCILSLLSGSLVPHVLLVDNGSTDDTISHIKRVYPQLEVIALPNNLGFGQANNIGLKRMLDEEYHYAFLLNQDAKIQINTLEHLVYVAQSNSQYGIISPFHYSWDSQKVDHFFLRMVNPDDCPDFLSDYLLNKAQDIYTLPFIHAACWLISRPCIEKVGGFDPLFYHYGEDNDYISRALQKGFKIGIAPKTKVYHYGFYDVSKKTQDNARLLKVDLLLHLKNTNGTLLGNYVLFIKRTFDKITSALLTRQFKPALIFFNHYYIALTYFWRIKTARKKSIGKHPFL